MIRIHRNYMLSLPGEGSCNPYTNVHGDLDWLGDFDGARYNEMRISSSILAAFRKTTNRPSRSQISFIARDLLQQAWRRRKSEQRGKGTPDPFKVIDPVQVFKDIGYTTGYLDTLGQFEDIDGVFEAAGQVDPSTKVVWISRRFSPEYARFTAAHELGHAILHRGMSLHRDGPASGAHSRRARAPEEADADYFAACFLMPEQLVRDEFQSRFLTAEFVLNEAVAFALGYPNLQAVRMACRAHEELAKLLAGAKFFNLNHFVSLAEQFGVSVEAMAIRLQELKLVTVRSGGKK